MATLFRNDTFGPRAPQEKFSRLLPKQARKARETAVIFRPGAAPSRERVPRTDPKHDPKSALSGTRTRNLSDPLFSTSPRPNAPETISRSGKWGFRPRRIDCRAVRPNPSSGCRDIPKFSPKIHEMPTFPKLQNLLGLVVGRALHLRLGISHLGDRWRIERGSRWYFATLRQPRGCRAIPLFVIRVPKYRHF